MSAGSADIFKGLHHRLEPDYTKPILQLPASAAGRIRNRLRTLYGDDLAASVYSELERVMRVHYAYNTAELIEAERQVRPDSRFTERDVVLITYGDLVVSENRSPLRTLADFAEVFFRGIVTTLHILPFFPYSSDRGFSVISYTEVDPMLGTWEDIAELETHFKLMFDVVVNHCSSKSDWFRRYLGGDPDFEGFFIAFTTRDALDEDRLRLILRPRTTDLLTEFATINGPRWVWTTFSADQVDLNFKNPKVLITIVETLLRYVRRGADLLRLDAITYLWRELGTTCAHLEQTHEVVKLLRDVLDVVAPHVAIVTETNVPHKDNITYFGDGHDEAQMVYNFALPPLVLHAFLTAGADTLSSWARDLEPPSDATCFFNFLDSHDGIGVMGARGLLAEEEILAICDLVRERGGFVSMKSDSDGGESPYELNITWFSALNGDDDADPVQLQVDRFIASRAVALVLRGVPGIYLPSMFGSKNDREAVWRDNTMRSINRSAVEERRLFEAFGDSESVPARIASRYVDLLEVRTRELAFHPNGRQRVVDAGSSVFAVLRTSPDRTQHVLNLINVSPGPAQVALDLADIGLPAASITDLVSGRKVATSHGRLRLTLAPYQVAWLSNT